MSSCLREFWRLWRNDGFDELLARYDDFFTEDLEWHSPVARMTGRSYVGRAGLAAHLADLRESFTDIKADPTKIAEIAPDVVRSDVADPRRGTDERRHRRRAAARAGTPARRPHVLGLGLVRPRGG